MPDDIEKPRLPHLEPSALGTKEYWDKAYTLEIDNHADDPGDEGTIWFADSGAEEKMLCYLEDLLNGHCEEQCVQNESLRMLDLGTGNGHLLFALRDEGWCAEMVGVDYSGKSVELARQIQMQRQRDQSQTRHVEFEKWDLLRDDPEKEEWLGERFDVVLDKGTFDAISLSDECNEQGKKGCEVYAEKTLPLLKLGGYLLITSCNWTEAELRRWFEGPTLTYHDTIRYPSFQFGGKTGQTVSSVCFKRSKPQEIQ